MYDFAFNDIFEFPCRDVMEGCNNSGGSSTFLWIARDAEPSTGDLYAIKLSSFTIGMTGEIRILFSRASLISSRIGRTLSKRIVNIIS
ncbi:MAG: hypothetical protein QM426_09830 [Euryarchaeota archaeon]|nr:hypothetical protein [Euryarchaeota archaeon]